MIEHNSGYWESVEDFAFRFVVLGRPAVLKNNKQAFLRGKRPVLLPSKRAQEWMETAADQLATQRPFNQPLPIDVPLWVTATTYAHDRRRRDLDNAFGCPFDVLTPPTLDAKGKIKKPGASIITDDSQIVSVDGSRLFYDKDNPRVDIMIRPYCGGVDELLRRRLGDVYMHAEPGDPLATLREIFGG